MTLRALAGLVGPERRLRGRSASRSSGRFRGFRAGRTSSGSPGSATCSAWRRSGPLDAAPRAGRAVRRVAIVVTLVGDGRGIAGVLGGPRPPRPRRRGPTGDAGALLVTAAGIALAGLLLEALFRSARLQSLQAYDAWAFWVPKAKAIYFFGGLDEQVFTTTPGPTYPPLVPILDAAAFHAMGSADTVTLHLQYWFLVVGAVARSPAASIGTRPRGSSGRRSCSCSSCRASGAAADAAGGRPRRRALRRRGAPPRALARDDQAGWRLGAAALLARGATLTKREGLLFAAACSRWRSPHLGATAAAWVLGCRGLRLVAAVAIPVAPLVPQSAGSEARRRPTRASAVARPDAWTRSASRWTSSSTRALVGRPGRRPDRARRRDRLGRPAARRSSRPCSSRSCSSAALGRPTGTRSCRSRRTRRSTRSCATPARSSSSPRSRPRSCSRRPGGAIGRRDDASRLRDRAAATIVVVPLVGYPLVTLADGARFPSREDCVRMAPPARRRRSTSCSGGATRPAEAEEPARAGAGRRLRRRGGARGRLRALEGALRRDRVVRAGLESRAEARGAGLEAWLEVEPPADPPSAYDSASVTDRSPSNARASPRSARPSSRRCSS